MTASTAQTETLDLTRNPAVNELTILGNGFFIVRDPNSAECYATQAGNFTVDADGYLVTEQGARVQGRTDIHLPDVGDIHISPACLSSDAAADNSLLYYAVEETGQIVVHLADGTSFVCGQILLQNFEDPRALVNEGARLYSNLSDAGPLPTPAAPGSNGLGAIHTGTFDFCPKQWAA